MITPYHAKYFANELTKRCPSNSIEKLASSLADARVDLNPHQIEAALFAFRSLLSKGAILADEVGLGKPVEEGTHRNIKELAKARHAKLKSLFNAQDAVDPKKEELLSFTETRLKRHIERADIFTMRWRVV